MIYECQVLDWHREPSIKASLHLGPDRSYSMLTDGQILHLLARCEVAAGCRLQKVRNRLKEDDWLATVWEMVVADAISKVGRFTYESKTPGGARPDFSLEIYDGTRVWIDAAFAFVESRGTITSIEEHRLFRILEGKDKQAKRTGSNIPFVICIGTDRVSSLSPFRSPAQVSRDRAVYGSFLRFTALSAVIVVPVLIKAKVMSGLERHAEPILFKNPHAISPVSEILERHLNRLDFNHWPFSITTDLRAARSSLCKALEAVKGAPLQISNADSSEGSSIKADFTGQSWVYCWRFHTLRIVRMADHYSLFDGGEIVATFPTAEAAAAEAAFLFQQFPYHNIVPSGIVSTSFPSVPANLGEWTLES